MANFARLKNIKNMVIDFFSIKKSNDSEDEQVDAIRNDLDAMALESQVSGIEVVDRATEDSFSGDIDGESSAIAATAGAEDIASTEEDVIEESDKSADNNENIDAEEEVVNEDPVLAELESLKITSVYPIKEAKKLIKERDRKYFEELYTTEKAIKSTDTQANQWATYIAGATGAVYMGFIAASAVALPAVVMALIGFGVGGGIIYGINKLVGKESAFGSLYRKLKTKFGKIRPSINVKNYRKEHDALKVQTNDVINADTDNYIDKLAIEDEVDDSFKGHIQALTNDEESTYDFEDDEQSKQILDGVTAGYRSAIDANYELITKKEELEENRAKNVKFIKDSEDCKKDINNKQAQASNEFRITIVKCANEVKNLNNAVASFINAKEQLAIELQDIENDKQIEIDNLNQTIEKIESLPNKDAKEYVDAIAKARADLADIESRHAERRVAAEGQFDAEVASLRSSSVIFDANFDIIQSTELTSANDENVKGIANKYIDIVLNNEAAKFEADLEDYISPYDDGVIIRSEYSVNQDNVSKIVDNAFGDSAENTEDPILALISDFDNRNQEITERLIVGFDYNINRVTAENNALNAQITETEDKITELETKTKEMLAKSKEELKLRRAEITNEAAQQALENARRLNAEFEQFKVEQSERFNNELATTTPIIEKD